MKITKKTIQEMIREELKSLNERPRKLPRQLKDKKKEMLVVKNGKVQVIDKKDWNKYKRKGYLVAENINEAEMTETLNITGYYGSGKSPKMTLNVDKLNVNSPLEKIIHAYLDSYEELENSEYGSYSYDEADSDMEYLDGLLRKKKISNKELNKLYKKFSRDKKYPIIAEQNLNEKSAKQAVSGGKVHPFITGLELKYKGKKHPEIEFEVQGIDNQSKLVKLRVLSPKQHFGDEMNVPFKTIRRGRFVKTDTSK